MKIAENLILLRMFQCTYFSLQGTKKLGQYRKFLKIVRFSVPKVSHEFLSITLLKFTNCSLLKTSKQGFLTPFQIHYCTQILKYLPSNVIREKMKIWLKYVKDFLCQSKKFLKLYFPSTGVS